MMQYYKDIWPRRSHILAPLTVASSSKNKKMFKWIDWNKENHGVRGPIGLARLFKTISNTHWCQWLTTRSSTIKDLETFSLLYHEPYRYTKEMYYRRKGFFEYNGNPKGIQRNDLRLHHSGVHWLNLVHETTVETSDRVMRWTLLLEKFGIQTIHIKGKKNVVAAALSRLDLQTMKDSIVKELNPWD